MGHEVIVFGGIEGVEFEPHQKLNEIALDELPTEDEWPWLVRGMFTLPAGRPGGAYRSQVIHFGASFKDEPGDRSCWIEWVVKLETLLRRMYWWSATLHLETEFEPERIFRWLPSAAAIDHMAGNPSQPVGDWNRSMIILETQPAKPHDETADRP